MKTPFAILVALFACTHAHAQTFELVLDAAEVKGEENLHPTDISWNECRDPVSGNYAGASCTSQRKISDEFLPFMQTNFVKCVNSALGNVGGGKATKVHIIHDGVMADSAHSSRSLHAIGRAIDVQQLKVTTASGTRFFDFRKTSREPSGVDRKFYEGFRSCWGSLQIQRGCPRRSSGAPVGTIGWEDSKHRGHHLHTSLPYCPSSRGYFTTKFDFDVEEDAEENGPYVEEIDI